MKYLSILITVLWAFAFIGCSSTKTKTPQEAFLNSLGTERTNYIALYTVSIESLIHQEDEVLHASRIIAGGISNAVSECTNKCFEVDRRIDGVTRLAEGWHDNRIKMIKDLALGYNPRLDALWFYHYRTIQVHEVGWMITTGAKIKKKCELSSDSSLNN